MIQAGLPTMTFGSMPQICSTRSTWEEQIGNSLIVREPVGVVGAITPWNYPLHQIAAKVAPALAAGCTVVLKPSEVAPLNAFILAEIIDEVGLPAGVFNLVTGTGPVVGEAIAAHPDVDMVSFTGSTRAGKRVSELAAQTVKRVALELGGKSANVILDDADLAAGRRHRRRRQVLPQLRPDLQRADAHARAARAARRGRGDRQAAAEGATRSATRSTEAPQLGPLVVRRPARARARLHPEGHRGGRQAGRPAGRSRPKGLERATSCRPTVFSDVTPDMTIAQEEIFGPVLSIIPYDAEDEAVRIANDTIYGLAGGVWSGDAERAQSGSPAGMRTGQVEINGGAFNPLAPFGGYKQSGHGREFGPLGLAEFTELKSMQR